MPTTPTRPPRVAKAPSRAGKTAATRQASASRPAAGQAGPKAKTAGKSAGDKALKAAKRAIVGGAKKLKAAVITKANRKPIKSKWPPDSKRVRAILDELERLYPGAECELHHETPFQLLCATILSAQCTDERVNRVTPQLFAAFPDARAMAEAPPPVLEDLVKSTGFFRQKTKSLLGTSQILVAQHGGEVPRDVEALRALPGVARKTANVVMGTAFGEATGVVVDTHVQRLALRLALTRNTTPEKIEQDLMEVIPREEWIALAHKLIFHGRRLCYARKPDCEQCPLVPHCPSAFRET